MYPLKQICMLLMYPLKEIASMDTLKACKFYNSKKGQLTMETIVTFYFFNLSMGFTFKK